MDFFSSLNEVRKNSSQLDRWEQQQRDKDAQRKAYQAKHAPTSDEVLKPDSAEQPESTTTADEQSDILLDEQKETRTQPRVSFRHQATQADLIDSKQSKCCILI